MRDTTRQHVPIATLQRLPTGRAVRLGIMADQDQQDHDVVVWSFLDVVSHHQMARTAAFDLDTGDYVGEVPSGTNTARW